MNILKSIIPTSPSLILGREWLWAKPKLYIAIYDLGKMMGTEGSPSFHCHLSSDTSTKLSGTLSKKSSEESTGVPLIPMRASTLYSVDVNLPTLRANSCAFTSSTSDDVNE